MNIVNHNVNENDGKLFYSK